MRVKDFEKSEMALWGTSVLLIVSSFFAFDRSNYLTLTASIIGVTSLILNAKGKPIGQLLMVAFSLLYGAISLSFRYYGEMLTYLGMTAPMAVFSYISWLKNPFDEAKAEVKVHRLNRREMLQMILLTAVVTFVFFHLLAHFHTANLLPSTISVTTSFLAVYLTFRRSVYYAVAYAANDLILILLWLLAAASNLSYLSVVICFAVFFVNDLYGFASWSRMRKRQEAQSTAAGKSNLQYEGEC